MRSLPWVNTSNQTEVAAVDCWSSKMISRLVPDSMEECQRNGTPSPANVTHSTENGEKCPKLKMTLPDSNVPTGENVRVQIVSKPSKIVQLFNCLKQWPMFKVRT